MQQNTDSLTQYKNIRTKSDVANIILRVASNLPQGTLLDTFSISYDQGDATNAHVTIDMKGNVFKEDPNEEIAVVNQIFSDIKNDKELARFVKSVSLLSLNREESNGRQATAFNIHCS